eukprot:CAMPEP_0119510952 /NCGR_PEP_ID=MMETSP1344-20130328/29757_1 /TAXON_ID=236787 /ORGANISM="Florenciella parvula, Strain CCMP2471" /LENGTH=306 /DNA_ID=CAMNT_0007547905 /DNA_START=226 /DNA_END=1146 /DNA_ORIENTATION=+
MASQQGLSPFAVMGITLVVAGVGAVTMIMDKGKKERKGRKSAAGGKKFCIGGNWKCETNCAKVKEIIARLNGMAKLPDGIEVFVAPPMPHLATVTAELRADIAVSSQDCGNLTKYGAFTGEAFGGMLEDIGCEWALVGHSERRSYQSESNELVAQKAKAAIDAGIGAVVCIGEPLEVREAGIPALKKLLLDDQMTALVKVVGKDAAVWSQIVIAYEPVWAIGTGKTATPEDAQETHKIIRDWVSKTCGAAIAKDLRIQYGGSVKGASAEKMALQPDIDGFLVGGSSLKDDFLDIIANAEKGLAARK